MRVEIFQESETELRVVIRHHDKIIADVTMPMEKAAC